MSNESAALARSSCFTATTTSNREVFSESCLWFFLPLQEEYRAEGITWHNIDYIDNSGCLNLISKKPTALFHLLDEECKYVNAAR